MDSLITAGGRALASGDALGALNCIALRDDPPALALRGLPWPSLAIWPEQGCLRRCHLHHERLSNSSMPASQCGGCASMPPALR